MCPWFALNRHFCRNLYHVVCVCAAAAVCSSSPFASSTSLTHHITATPLRVKTRKMPTPTQPTFTSSPVAAPTDPDATLQAINNAGHHSPGAITGISICVLVCLAWILRYSYLASPFWLGHLRRWFGMRRPSSRTPISHFPLSPDADADTDTDTDTPTPTPTLYIARPDPAYIRSASKDTLPLYEPTNQFSSDVLEALLSLGPAAGAARPPSYRSKLSHEWRSAMGTRARNTRAAGRDDEESGRSISGRSTGSQG